ncbi:hypothetical protein JW930_04535 [Candidatus Woesearchaeota archaeon]|nr:hypothetical protein [Candidatus Woesearchaeota archaeon]
MEKGKKHSPSKIGRKSPKIIIETLYKELERKDKRIDELEERNAVLIRTALKAEERVIEWQDLVKKYKGSISSQNKNISQ